MRPETTKGQRGRRAGRSGRWLLIAAVFTGAAGCGDLTAGGVGDIEVLVSPDSIAVEAIAVGSGPARQTLPEEQRIEGTLQIQVQVFVLLPPGRWIQVTDGVQEVLLDLGDSEASTVARRSLRAGSYVAVRTVFHRVVADIDRGLEVNDEPVTGEINVDLGIADRIEIFRPLDLTVVEGQVTEIGLDMHAGRWLRRLDTTLRRVPARDFEDELGLRQRPRDLP